MGIGYIPEAEAPQKCYYNDNGWQTGGPKSEGRKQREPRGSSQECNDSRGVFRTTTEYCRRKPVQWYARQSTISNIESSRLASPMNNHEKFRVFVFSKTAGFRHDSIPAGIDGDVNVDDRITSNKV
ncbi:hypothetical protein F4861DRAFT_551575 [Xylaria intraflava]|nr:hypothetical protein F4861DRAFT_551575 [Xylaria intraflava]